jgi:hypothetical protein
MKRPNVKQLQAACDAWNAAHPVGSSVTLMRDSGPMPTRTRSAAEVLSGHSAVVWLDGVAGCYALDRVRPVQSGADAHGK